MSVALADLGPSLRRRTVEIEAARSLPDDVVADLRSADLFRVWTPSALGGPEHSAADGVDAFVELARHDAAAAWCAMIGSTTALLAAFLPPEHAEAIYGSPDAVTGGFAAPVGRAVPVEGGLRVTGRWAWGSGTSHCTAIGGGVVLTDDDGKPAPRADGLTAPFVFFDPADVEFHDTWHVLGLSGTGSTDYAVVDAFVPEGRWVQLAGTQPVIDRPLYRLPFFGMLAAGVAAVAVGVADRAIEEFVVLAEGKRPQGSKRTLARRESAQEVTARADAAVRGGRGFLLDTLKDAQAAAAAGHPVTDEHKRLVRLAAVDATQRCADAVGALHRAAGGEAVYDRSGVQRCFRDANVASQHAMVAARIYELAGRMRLGLDTDTRTL